jgi:hypothetical protein
MGGDKPVGTLVAVVAMGVLVALPALIVPTYYLFANGYALFTGSDFSSNTMNVPIFLTGLVVTVALFVVLMSVAVALVGKALTPKKRSKA